MNQGTNKTAKEKKLYKVAIIAPVPFYYHVPFYKKLSESPEIDLSVFYCSDETIKGEDIKRMYKTDKKIINKKREVVKFIVAIIQY